MIPGAEHRSPGICLTAEKKIRKTSARKTFDEGAVRSVLGSNGIPYLQLRPEGPHSKSGWVKEGKDRVG